MLLLTSQFKTQDVQSFLLRSVLMLNYSTDVKQHFKELLAARHMYSQWPASSEQRCGMGWGSGGEVGNRDLLPHKSQLIPVPSLQNRNGNVGNYVRYCNSYHWEVLRWVPVGDKQKSDFPRIWLHLELWERSLTWNTHTPAHTKHHCVSPQWKTVKKSHSSTGLAKLFFTISH